MLCSDIGRIEFSQVSTPVVGIRFATASAEENPAGEIAGILSIKKDRECLRQFNVHDDNVRKKGAWLRSERNEVNE